MEKSVRSLIKEIVSVIKDDRVIHHGNGVIDESCSSAAGGSEARDGGPGNGEGDAAPNCVNCFLIACFALKTFGRQ